MMGAFIFLVLDRSVMEASLRGRRRLLLCGCMFIHPHFPGFAPLSDEAKGEANAVSRRWSGVQLSPEAAPPQLRLPQDLSSFQPVICWLFLLFPSLPLFCLFPALSRVRV